MQAVIAKMEDYRQDETRLVERTLKTQELLNASVGELANIMRENNRIGQITNKSLQMGKIDEGKTLGGITQKKLDSIKDFFTARGFLEKTGMVQRGSGGLVDTALRKRQERQEYIEARKMVDPNMKNMKQFGGSDRKLDAYLGEQFEKSKKIRLEMQKNQEQISNLQGMGFTEQQIARSAPGKSMAGLEASLAQVDTRFRPNDLKITEKKKGTSDQNQDSMKKILKRDDLTTSEEEKENNMWRDTQLDYLADIRDSNQNMSDMLGDLIGVTEDAAKQRKEDQKEGMLGMLKRKAGMVAGAAGTGLAAAGRGAGRFLMGTGGKVLGGAALVGMAGYEAYNDFNDISAREEAGEITAREATVERGGATGKAAGTIGGGLAGAKLGAMAGAAIGSVVPGIGTAIGGLVGSIIGGIGGAFAGSKFGKMIGSTITDAALKIGELANEYIIEPIKNIGTKIGNMFNEYIYDPIANALAPIGAWFSQIGEDVKKFFTEMEIPGISFDIPLYGPVTFGPWRPFAPDPEDQSQSEPTPATTPAAAEPPSTGETLAAAEQDAQASKALVTAFEAEKGKPTKVVGYDPLGDAIMGYEDEETNEQYQDLVKKKNMATSGARRARTQAIKDEGGLDSEESYFSLENTAAKFDYLQSKGYDMSKFETRSNNNYFGTNGKKYDKGLINRTFEKEAGDKVDSQKAEALKAMQEESQAPAAAAEATTTVEPAAEAAPTVEPAAEAAPTVEPTEPSLGSKIASFFGFGGDDEDQQVTKETSKKSGPTAKVLVTGKGFQNLTREEIEQGRDDGTIKRSLATTALNQLPKEDQSSKIRSADDPNATRADAFARTNSSRSREAALRKQKLADQVAAESSANEEAKAASAATPPKVVVQQNNQNSSSNQTIAPAHKSRNTENSVANQFARNSVF